MTKEIRRKQFALGGALWLSCASAISAVTCPNGPTVDSVAHCAAFRVYRTGPTPEDQRINSRLDVMHTSQVRSIAFVVANSRYDKLPSSLRDLKAAKVDMERLLTFLRDDQAFDEVIVLENEAATAANIDYFLKTYLPQQGLEYQKKARLLFAYTGHGVPKSATNSAAFLLTDADGADDSDHRYEMETLRQRLVGVSRNYFHVVALINACYGGFVYGDSPSGGNASISDKPGSYALTAGSPDSEVASIDEAKGSVFFDRIIDGVRTGYADLDYQRLVDGNGTLIQQGGITRLGALANYLETEIEIINRQRLQTPTGPLTLDTPWIGPINEPSRISVGAFFFLSPYKLATGRTSAFEIGAGPKSSVPGHPEIKLFGVPAEYPVKGIDVSQFTPPIDWKVVAAKKKYRFAYVRATGWKGEDRAFRSNWNQSAAAGIDRGAYHVYDFCRSASQQMTAIEGVVASEESALPFAIDLEDPFGDQQACFEATPLEKSRQQVAELARLLHEKYAKTPIMYGSPRILARILDDRFNSYMVWVAVWKGKNSSRQPDLGLSGANPWTLWQYTDVEPVEGIGTQVDVNAFFGTEADYAEFKSGRINLARVRAFNGPKVVELPRLLQGVPSKTFVDLK